MIIYLPNCSLSFRLRIPNFKRYLSTNNRKNENGVSKFFYNRIADRAVFGQVIGEEPVNVPYLNSGVLQGEFAGVKRLYNGRNRWSLLVRDTVRHESGRELKRIHQFIIDKDELKFRAGRRKNGDPVLVEYRMESRKEVRWLFPQAWRRSVLVLSCLVPETAFYAQRIYTAVRYVCTI